MRIFAVIPIKLRNPKTRLSRFFNEDIRRKLVLTMLEDVLSACKSVDDINVVIVGNEKPSIDHDFYFIKDDLSGLTHAVSIGNKFAIKKGAEVTIFLPADIPLIKSDDIKEIIECSRESNVVLARSSKDGVSAVLRKPPDVFEIAFSNRSFIDIMRNLRKTGIKAKVVEKFSFWLDIDTIEDVKMFLKYGKGTRTYELLKESMRHGRY